MWIGSSTNSTAAPFGLTWRGSVKALGIVFIYNTTVQLQTNFYCKLKDIRTQSPLWSCRGQSRFGKTIIIKYFLLPKMLHIFSDLPTPGAFIIDSLTPSFTTFLRKGHNKVAWPAAISDLKYGGLNLMDLETSIESLRLAWHDRLFVKRSSPWKAFANHLLKDRGGIFLCRCNNDLNEYNINSIFYKDLLQ